MGEGQKNTILLVEDEALVAMAEAAMLGDHGYEVITAASGEEAVELVRSGAVIDIVLMDIDLGPGMDGTDAAEVILNERNVPLAFLSSHTEPETVAKIDGITSYGYIVKNSGDTVLLASINMAFRLWEREDRFRTSKERLEIISDNMLDLVALTDLQGNFQYVGKSHEILGYDLDYLIGKNVMDFVHPEDFPGIVEKFNEMLQTRLDGQVEYRIRRSDGSYLWLETFGKILKGEDRVVWQIIFTSTNVTDRREAEKALEYEGYLLHSIMDKFPGTIYFKDLESRFVRINKAQAELLGIADPAGAVGKTDFDYFSKEHAQQAYLDEQEIIRTGNSINKEEKLTWADKPGRWTLTTKMPLKDAEEKIIGTFGISIDFTQQKRAEGQIEALLAEKELVLKEVQHRIKNTMNTMVSLLSLQAASIKDEGAAAALNDAKSRFRSMEVLYDQLYMTEAHTGGSVKEYLTKLGDKVVHLFPAGEKIKVSTEIEDFSMDARHLSTLGMIVNELVTNAMKYAFGNGEGGRLFIGLNRDGGRVKLTVEDNGSGFTETRKTDVSARPQPQPAARSGFGLKMVRALAVQLGGSMGIENKNGTRVSIQFPTLKGGLNAVER